MRPTLEVMHGPSLLRTPTPELRHHRATHGELPPLSMEPLADLVDSVAVRGRGGAGFPFAAKLRATGAGRNKRHVVVNFSEGEPASFKDLALALTQPHLVLDGAAATARALGVRTVQLVLPAEHPDAHRALARATAERAAEDRARGVRWQVHRAADRFVAGEASAVTELLAGRPGLPVTSWEPTAVRGVRQRPTLLSNAETFAQVGALVLHGAAAYAAVGTRDEPGTSLLTLGGDGSTARVLEVAHGTPWEEVLPPEQLDAPVLLGGFHGTWVAPGGLRGRTVSRTGLRAAGLALGAGIVLPLPVGVCPLGRTARLVRYLAGQSARRCGPCLNGLPALADAVRGLVEGGTGRDVARLGALVERRGACAHPDGTVRMVRSAMHAFPDEVAAHQHGACVVGSSREAV